MRRITLRINAIDCKLCGVIIESVLSRTSGIQSASVNDDTKVAEIVFDQKSISVKQIQDKILSLGYRTDLLSESQL